MKRSKKVPETERLTRSGLFTSPPACITLSNEKNPVAGDKGAQIHNDFFQKCAPNVPIPLESIFIDFHVIDSVASFQVKQVYVNSSTSLNLDVTYYFPLSEKAAISSVNVVLQNGVKLIGILKGKKEATEEFEQNVEKGNFAIQVNQEYAEMLQFQLGNLPPKQKIEIEVNYAIEIEQFDDLFQLIIPTYISPRYSSSLFPVIETEIKKLPDINYVYSSDPSQPRDYSLTLQGCICSSSEIQNVSLSSHPKIELKIEKDIVNRKKHQHTPAIQKMGETSSSSLNSTTNTYIITGMNNVALDRDVILTWSLADKTKPRLYLEPPLEWSSASPSWCSMVSFTPSFGHDENTNLQAEYVFVLDRSGSMDGVRLQVAKKALILFLKSLPLGCYFNVLSFGDNLTFMWPKSIIYTDDNVREAIQIIEKMEANLGGTELQFPIRAVFSSTILPRINSSSKTQTTATTTMRKPKGKSKTAKTKTESKFGTSFLSRQTILLTDGDVFDTVELVRLIENLQQEEKQQNLIPCRLFTLGIGESSNKNLIRTLAEYGHGTWRFVSTNMKDIGKQVIELLKLAQSSAIEEVKIDWQLNGTHLSSSLIAPISLKSLFEKNQYNLYAFFPIQELTKISKPTNLGTVILTINKRNKFQQLESSQFELNFQIPSSQTKEQLKPKSFFLKQTENETQFRLQSIFHHLAARVLLSDPLLSRQEKKRISLENHTLGSETSFLLIDELKQLEPNKKNLKLHVNIPVYTNSPLLVPLEIVMFKNFGGAPGVRAAMKRKKSKGAMRLASKQGNQEKSKAQQPAEEGIAQESKKQDSLEEKNQILFDALIYAQSVEGYFDKSQIESNLWKQVEQHPQVEENFIRFKQKINTKAKTTKLTSQIDSTIKVLLFLHYDPQMKEKYSEWEKVAQKAESWLNANGGPKDILSFLPSLQVNEIEIQEEQEQEQKSETQTTKTIRSYFPYSIHRTTKISLSKFPTVPKSKRITFQIRNQNGRAVIFNKEIVDKLCHGEINTSNFFAEIMGFETNKNKNWILNPNPLNSFFTFEEQSHLESCHLYLCRNSNSGLTFQLETKTSQQNSLAQRNLEFSFSLTDSPNPNGVRFTFSFLPEKETKLWLWKLQKVAIPKKQEQKNLNKKKEKNVVNPTKIYLQGNNQQISKLYLSPSYFLNISPVLLEAI